jgi:hypothetical protein
VRNKEDDGVPIQNIERNPIIILTFAVISAIFIYIIVTLLRQVNPLGFLVIMPAAVFSFQTLWFLLNPFAVVYEKKVTIRRSLLHHSDHYYIDIKKIDLGKTGKVFITYNDGEVEPLKLFGIKQKDIPLLKNEVEKLIPTSKV